MSKIGYHCSHEQFSPSDLLELVQMAEQAGFPLAMCSDHFYPWSEGQKSSGFAWTWLGAAMAKTSLPFGVVTTPGYRYHPAIMAQACATLGEMYPDRFWVATGSGEWLNEHIIGGEWPNKSERNARLKESVDIMRALWAGETVSRKGRIEIDEARLYVLPEHSPPVIGPALTPETAEWLGGWADGLVTVNQPGQKHAEVLEAFRRGGGEGKPVYLQAHLSWADDEQAAVREAHDQWRNLIFASSVLAELKMPDQFDAVGAFVTEEDLKGHVRISADLDRHIEWLREDLDLGFDAIYLHNVGLNQREFIRAFGERVLPALSDA